MYPPMGHRCAQMMKRSRLSHPYPSVRHPWLTLFKHGSFLQEVPVVRFGMTFARSIKLTLLLAACASMPLAWAQPAGGPPRPPMPKPGPTPLPVLPALPAKDDTSFYAKTDVPHGKVEQATYKTQSGQDKRLHVYLPPDYDKNADAKYPVLYLNHGGGDDDAKWTSTDARSGGSAQFILDNLI